MNPKRQLLIEALANIVVSIVTTILVHSYICPRI